MTEGSVERPGGSRSRRFVFRGFESVQAVERLAADFSWERIGERPASDERPRLVRWRFFEGVDIDYIEDQAIRSSYVYARSKVGSQPLTSVLTAFDFLAGVCSCDELLAGLESSIDSEDRANAVARVGLGAPLEPDRHFIDAIERCANDADDEIRECAVWAMVYSEWVEFGPSLAKISESDSDAYLRELAAGAIASFRRLGLGEK